MISTKLAPFDPTTVTARDLYTLAMMLMSLSDHASEVACNESLSFAARTFADDIGTACFDLWAGIADHVHTLPADGPDAAVRSYLLAIARVRMAEGPVQLVGEGAPDQWRDASTC